MSNIGKIRLKAVSELQLSNCNKAESNIDDIKYKTPEKKKKARNIRAATTIKKKNIETEQIVANCTVVKHRPKKETPAGQLRIDCFFKSAAKSFKVEAAPPSSIKKPELSTSKRSKGKAMRKRLFEESSTTSTSASVTKESDCQGRSRSRSQPARKVKLKMDTDEVVIDLCSDVEESEMIGTIEALPIEEPNKAPLPMVTIPLNSSSKENASTVRTRKPRPCPPYKIIEGTTFAVDGFQFGDIPNVTHYFLTHYHADHYVGLTGKFAHPVYMSPMTARLVRTFIPVKDEYIREIELDKPIVVNDIEITAIEANHCPGAIMLLFKLSTGICILHTGDFRASAEMESLPIFWNQQNIDILYLDTTYLSQRYDFCHQTDSIERTIELVRQFREKNAAKRILYVCGSYVIGKEKIWLALAEEFNLRVWTEPHRRKAINCLQWHDLQFWLDDDSSKANLHVISMGKISYPRLVEYFEPYSTAYDMLLAIRPSGWEKNSRPSYGKKISVIGVEYSEHSSYKELERFVRFLRPKRVISTVPVGRDLFATGQVPKKWYEYQGRAAMLSTGYQPSIATFLTKTPRRIQRNSLQLNEMLLSPTENDNCGLKVSPQSSEGTTLPRTFRSPLKSVNESMENTSQPLPLTELGHEADKPFDVVKQEATNPSIALRCLTSDAADDWPSA